MNDPLDPAIVFVPDHEETRVELHADGQCVSRLWIVPRTLRVGKAEVRMDGIGGVGTEESHRLRGYSRRVLEAAVRRMAEGDAALSMLYGIRDYYTRFGYATAGPEHRLRLTHAVEPRPLPDGWSARPYEPGDLPTLSALYDAAIADAVGAAVRSPGEGVWARLRDAEPEARPDACRVVCDASGAVRGYAWRGAGFWPIEEEQPGRPDTLLLGEVIADSVESGRALIAVCHAWAAEEAAKRERPVGAVETPTPPNTLLCQAAALGDAMVIRGFARCGGSMARVLNVERLLRALLPELDRRARKAGVRWEGALRIETEIGSAGLLWERDSLRCSAEGASLRARMPQATLARLALGAYPPALLLSEIEAEPATRAALAALFPERHPHMYVPDRY